MVPGQVTVLEWSSQSRLKPQRTSVERPDSSQMLAIQSEGASEDLPEEWKKKRPRRLRGVTDARLVILNYSV